MSTISFGELVSKFQGLHSHILSNSVHPALSFPSSSDTFVDPPIEELMKSNAPNTPIIVISAPGAVGKSTLAQQLCAETGACYWNLSKTRLGNYTFRGTIADAFGEEDSQVLIDLKKGDTAFILDAFDEADILSGWEGVEIFIREAWEVVKQAPKPVLVMLARYDTAQYIQILLDYLGNDVRYYNSYQIQYFSSEKAVAFVKACVRDIETEAGKNIFSFDQHPQPFYQAIDSAFKSISRSFGDTSDDVWSKGDIRDFIGYAPVLQAIARYLTHLGDNYQAVRNQIEQSISSGTGSNLLSQLLEGLLTREQEKFLSAFRQRALEKVTKHWDGWNKLYTPAEQIHRLFACCHNSIVNDRPQIPYSITELYEESIKAFLPQHPFLRDREFAGPAFRDYVYSKLLNNATTRKTVEAIAFGEYVPTPLLAQFYLSDSQGLGYAVHAGILYESVIASQDSLSDGYELEIFPNDDEGNEGESMHHMTIIFTNDNAQDQSRTAYEIELLVSPSEPVIFTRRIRHSQIRIAGQLTLGQPSREFELSDAEISCQLLSIQANRLFVRCPDQSDNVQIVAEQMHSSNNYSISIKKHGEGSFAVSWPGSEVFPWHEYSGTIFAQINDRMTLMLALRRILRWFRRDRREEFARFAELINNVAVGSDPVRKEILQFLLHRGIISYKDPLYYYDPAKAQSYGVNWSDLRRGNLTPSIQHFFNEFEQYYHQT